MVNEEDAVEMVDFMLETPAQKSLGFNIHRVSIFVYAPYLDPLLPVYVSGLVLVGGLLGKAFGGQLPAWKRWSGGILALSLLFLGIALGLRSLRLARTPGHYQGYLLAERFYPGITETLAYLDDDRPGNDHRRQV